MSWLNDTIRWLGGSNYSGGNKERRAKRKKINRKTPEERRDWRVEQGRGTKKDMMGYAMGQQEDASNRAANLWEQPIPQYSYGGLSDVGQQQLDWLNADTKRNYWGAQQNMLSQMGQMGQSSVGRQQRMAMQNQLRQGMQGNYLGAYHQDFGRDFQQGAFNISNEMNRRMALGNAYMNQGSTYGQQANVFGNQPSGYDQALKGLNTAANVADIFIPG